MKKITKKTNIFIVLALLIAVIFWPLSTTHAQTDYSLAGTITGYYNQYSRHLDEYGLQYASPTYGVPEFKTAKTARETASLASYYKYRSTTDRTVQSDLRRHILKSLQQITSRNKDSLSFHDAEALFLISRLIEHNPSLLSSIEQEYFWHQVAKLAPHAIFAPDTENRAIISAVHWQYLLNQLLAQDKINSLWKSYLDLQIRHKIDTALEATVVQNKWYLENNQQDFSPHYQSVVALMLTWYHHQTGQSTYLATARNMYQGLKQMAFSNGMIEARIGKRPVGLGSQFYLMMASVGDYLSDSDRSVFFNHLKNDNYFSDPRYPNRLEFHSTAVGTAINFHDDYAFSDKAEVALILHPEANYEVRQYLNIEMPVSYQDNLFKINNYGNKIIINNKTFIQTRDGQKTVIR